MYEHLLVDLYDCLELNEIEKCQLVSKLWNRSILYNKDKLLNRRRRIYRLTYNFYTHQFRSVFTHYFYNKHL